MCGMHRANMQLSSLKEHSHIYGFEPSFVIWTQGCPIRCKGCWNTHTWDSKGGFAMDIESIFHCIKAQKDSTTLPIQAVTILGGEPFYQYEELYELVSLIKTIDLGIIVYSGYEKNELIEKKKDSIFSLIDVLIYGRYIESLRDLNLHLRGSSNQVIDFLSKRYNESLIKDGNYIEIDIDNFGRLDIVGYIQNLQDIGVGKI